MVPILYNFIDNYKLSTLFFFEFYVVDTIRFDKVDAININVN